jgi:hypothetical protein
MDGRYLTILAEECAEVIQEVCKGERFGLDKRVDSTSPYPAVRDRILIECGDIIGVLEEMLTDHEWVTVRTAALHKREKLKTYGPDGTYIKDRRHPNKPTDPKEVRR